MSTTVLEALRDARINFGTFGNSISGSAAIIHDIAMSQLLNAITALENGMNANDVIQGGIGEPVRTGRHAREGDI